MHSSHELKSLDEIRQILSTYREVLPERYGVRSIAVFGSYARGEATELSDIDPTVEFTEKPGLLKFVNLEAFLSETSEIPVQLTTLEALGSEIRENALGDAMNITN